MAGPESKTSTMRLATDKLAEAESIGLEGELKELDIKNQIKDAQLEIENKIKQIESEETNESDLRVEADLRLESEKKAHARDKVVCLQRAENEIAEASLALEDMSRGQADRVRSAELTLSRIRREADGVVAEQTQGLKTLTDNLIQVIAIAQEAEERANLESEHCRKKSLALIKDAEKAKKLKIATAKADGERKIRQLDRQLEIAQLKNKAAGGGKKVLYQRLYNDTLALGMAQANAQEQSS